MTTVDPLFIQWPKQWLADPEIAQVLFFLDRFLNDIRARTGGDDDDISGLQGRILTAGTGLTGGGDLTADRTFNVVAGTGITASADAVATNDSEILHNSLSGYSADQHVAHTGVSIVAGTGLTGGGTIAGSVTLNAIAGTGITVNANDIQTNDSAIVHHNLSGFVADEHVLHAGVSITAGTGLTGGGNISTSSTLNVIGGNGIIANANDIEIDTSVVIDISGISTYAPTNVTPVRAFDADSTTLAEIADVLGTLISDLTLT